MSLTVEQKRTIITQFGHSEQDTGSAEVQIALLSEEIKQLTEHFKIHHKDHASRRGLMRKVSLRRKLLAYLKAKDLARYSNVIAALGLRG